MTQTHDPIATTEPFDRVRDALHAGGAKFRDVRQDHMMATCPAHEDKNPSLSVDNKQGRVMVHCHAGCQPDEVLAAIGLEFSDLFADEPDKHRALRVRTYVYETASGAPWILKDRLFPKGFAQRLPGTEVGDRTGLKGREPVLYRLPKINQALRTPGTVLYLVEGEKDVESCERHGLLATCTPGGAGSLWREQYSKCLANAGEVVIVADQDPVKPDGSLGSGQQHAADARAGLRAAGVKVRIVAPRAGKDATDHFDAGFCHKDFAPETTAFTRPRGKDAAELMDLTFDPLTWAVKGVLPAGLAILAGSPKAGKSWCALSMSLAVASGGPALSCLATEQGSVLHLAREDGYRRLQQRIRLLMGGSPAPKGLEFVPSEHEWVGGDQGLANMTEWAEEVKNPRLVVIDTLAKVEPDMGESPRGGAYSGNYSMMARYKQWADVHNVCVLMIHHDNKTKLEPGADVFSRISGTRGLTGAADTMLFLESVRGTREGKLHLTGRDVAEQTLDLYKSGPVWNSASLVDLT